MFQIKNKIDEEKVLNELKKEGYWPHSVMDLDYVLVVDSFDTLEYISYGLFIISMLVVVCLIFYNLSKNKNIIELNKILGYSNKSLLFNSLIEIITLFISSIISISIFTFLSLILFRKIMPIYYKTFEYIEVLISPYEFMKTLLFVSIIILVIFIIKNKLIKDKNIKL